jgi:LPS-assembly lipoprotein
MSLFDSEGVKRRRFLSAFRSLALPLVPALFALQGCGFHPLYGEPNSNDGEDAASVPESLEQVLILPIGHRVGQQLHNLLRDRLNPSGQPASPDYTLSVQLSERVEELGIQIDATATRARLTMIANFALLDVPDQDLLYRGIARFTNSFDILEDPYATQVAEFHARERSLVALSDQMKIRLASYFRSSSE